MNAFTFGLFLLMAALLVFYVLRIFSQPRVKSPSQSPSRFEITFDSAGFTLISIPPCSTGNVRMLWTEVNRVAAYKVIYAAICDLTIYLQFSRPDGTGIELDEGMVGWEPFCAALPKRLPGYHALPNTIGEIADTPAKGVLYQRITV